MMIRLVKTSRAMKLKVITSLGFLGIMVSLAVHLNGCGLIFGGSSKVDRKNHGYTVVRLDKTFPDRWNLDQNAKAGGTEGSKLNSFNEEVDMAFDHKKVNAFISLNSVCNEAEPEVNLESLLKSLIMGTWDGETEIEKQDIQIDGRDALQATFLSTVPAEMHASGKSGAHEPAKSEAATAPASMQRKVRAVVLAHQGCTFDFLYVAAPKNFDENLADFEKFVHEFHMQ